MKDHYCVIMGGGIGSRFWPFSRTNYPKQFLDFFGTGRSLLQMTVDRFSKIIPKENILVVTNEIYASVIAEQLPELDASQILFEPQRRNTAPCIAWASYHIRALNPNAKIVVAPSDHVILKEEEFLRVISEGLKFVSENETLLTLGIQPSRPETGYGYIQVEDISRKGPFYRVKTFTEKPNLDLAKVFVESGEFFWNSGLFLWDVNHIIRAFEQHLPDVASNFEAGVDLYGTEAETEFIKRCFSLCPNISIDYGVMEKATNVNVLCAEFGWSDLGTWGSLYELSDKDECGNVCHKNKLIAYESERNIVNLADGKLAVIHGLNDYIVAESGNVLLICKMEDEQKIRQFVADAQLTYGNEYV